MVYENRGRGLIFNLGDIISVAGNDYTVEGIIEFNNHQELSSWTEYKIRNRHNGQIAWLSIDTIYREYAIYFQKIYNSQFEHQNIINRGYHEVDSGKATVSRVLGDVDVDCGDSVVYKEYEDASEENIVSVEIWDDEIECSIGYYLSAKEIIRKSYNNGAYFQSYSENRAYNLTRIVSKIFSIVTLLIIGMILYSLFGGSSKRKISKYLAKSNNYTYVTSMTANLNNKQKADIYSSPLSIDTVAKDIIKHLEGDVAEVQQNSEDSSIGILTKYEYCFLYKMEGEEDGDTMILIGQRAYAYSSTHRPYRSSIRTSKYYRDYYYTAGYTTDKNRFSSNNDAYVNYDGDIIFLDSSNPYKTYSNNIRQLSLSRRSSSGGGTSFGK